MCVYVCLMCITHTGKERRRQREKVRERDKQSKNKRQVTDIFILYYIILHCMIFTYSHVFIETETKGHRNRDRGTPR